MTITLEAPAFTDAAELLKAAADHLQRYGWHQCSLYPGDAAYLYTARSCMLGAIRAAARVPLDMILLDHDAQPPLVKEAEEILADAVLCMGGKTIYSGDDIDPVETVGDWNDADNCDADSAIELLRDAAELAR